MVWKRISDGVTADGKNYAMWKDEMPLMDPHDNGLDSYVDVIEDHVNGSYIMLFMNTAASDSYWNYNPRLSSEDSLL
jgi:hypothetical protein